MRHNRVLSALSFTLTSRIKDESSRGLNGVLSLMRQTTHQTHSLLFFDRNIIIQDSFLADFINCSTYNNKKLEDPLSWRSKGWREGIARWQVQNHANNSSYPSIINPSRHALRQPRLFTFFLLTPPIYSLPRVPSDIKNTHSIHITRWVSVHLQEPRSRERGIILIRSL